MVSAIYFVCSYIIIALLFILLCKYMDADLNAIGNDSGDKMFAYIIIGLTFTLSPFLLPLVLLAGLCWGIGKTFAVIEGKLK